MKNNLQLVSSLLGLQSATLQDPQTRALFKESQQRIRSMALIHEKLYRASSLAQIDLAEYIRQLANELLQAYRIDETHISLRLTTEKVTCSLDTAGVTSIAPHDIGHAACVGAGRDPP